MSRRSSREPRKASYKEETAVDDADPMQVDDGDDDDETSDVAEPTSENEDEDDDVDDDSMSVEPITTMVRKRRAAAAKVEEPSLKVESRRPSRAARYQGSMKEPPSDSVRDLFQGSSTKQRVLDNDEDDEDGTPRKKTKSIRRLSPAKSPARRHSRARKSVKDEASSDDESDEGDYYDEDEEDSEGDEQTELRIHRILASRTETRAKWREIGSRMNTSEVSCGSVWNQPPEDNLELEKGDGDKIEERFLVKWADFSYLHVSWETQTDLLDQVDKAKTYLSTFFRKADNGILLSQDDRKDGDYFDPGYVQIDRILEVFYESKHPTTWEEELEATNESFDIVLDIRNTERFEEGTGRQFLIKWEGMNYSDCSYEFERDLLLADVEYKPRLKEFYERSKKPSNTEWKELNKNAERAMREAYKLFGDKAQTDADAREKAAKKYQEDLASHVFRNGGQLRDYQAEGVAWFLSNYINRRSCIMADEMGLGKTLQTAAFINLLVMKMHRPGPFLVVVPLSTITHWQREFVNWTGLNTFVYHGTAEDRSNIRQHEFAYIKDRPDSVGANTVYLNKCASTKRNGGPWMATVVVCTPEMLTADDANELAAVNWEVLVVDEAHRLKNHNSKLATTLRKDMFNFRHKVLLTGTPIQNDMKEFWTLLNFIDPNEFPNMDDFLEEYGSIKSKEKIDEMHAIIRPYILRRLKEDVEKSVPPKEETLIEVELTVQQKQYYRALYEKNVGFLQKNKKSALDGPSLNNLAMQLRKCCNHLFLLNGVEEELRTQPEYSNLEEADLLARGSGKLVLLDKLLPRLKETGHRILIFSQFKIMLDVLEDYLQAKNLKFERIDGSITGHRRQAAIDRFQDPAPKDPPFVMLLSTRAGGVGINLTAADTCIIFDSDWNPQNDLQAQARCHRIGQTKNVKVYRLLSRKSYEMQMFHMSSLKMGLDQAVLKGFESGSSGEGAMTKEEVERLLRHGAYDIFNEEKTGTAEAESNDFVQQDIDSILARRATTVVHDNTGSGSNAAGGTFSKASFVAPKTPSGKRGTNQEDVDIEDPDFWKKMVGEAKEVVESVLKPRKRKQAIYDEKFYERQLREHIALNPNSSDNDDYDSDDSDASEDETSEAKERARWGGPEPYHWKKAQAHKVLECLERYGYGTITWEKFFEALKPECDKFEEMEIRRMTWAITLLSFCKIAKEDATAATKRAQRLAEKKLEQERVGDILGVPRGESDRVNEAQQLESSFQRLWSTHIKWAETVLQDAVAFAKENEPRLLDTVEDQGAEISRAFYNTLWEPLQGRGWKEDKSDSGKIFRYNDQKFDSPSSVMNEVLRIHPELSNMVLPMLERLEQRRLFVSEKEKEDRERDIALSGGNVNYEAVFDFLLRYGPLQLLGEKRQTNRIPLGRRLLSTSKHMQEASSLLEKAREANSELKAMLSVDGRSMLPHPLWTSAHDATLIEAIVKHGWVDRDTACRSIVNDAKIKWGYPFELDGQAAGPKINGSETDNLRATAQRAASFLENSEELLDTLKGVNKKLIIEAYGLKHAIDEGGVGTGTWAVDEETLLRVLAKGEDNAEIKEAADLPAKNYLAKRAKLVLSKSVSILEGNTRGPPGLVPSGARNLKEGTKETVDHGFTTINQGDRCCILLAEMVRGVCKGSVSKASKAVKTLASLVLCEAQALRDQYFERVVNKTDVAKTKEMGTIVDQIELAIRCFKFSVIPAKNLFRAMIGLEPVQAKISSHPIYPSEAFVGEQEAAKAKAEEVIAKTKEVADSASATVKPKKEQVIKKDEDPLGKKAIIRAERKAAEKGKGGVPNLFTPEDDSELGLQLTMAESFILRMVCDEGIPLSSGSSGPTRNDSKDWETLFEGLKRSLKEALVNLKELRKLAIAKLDDERRAKVKVNLAKQVVLLEWGISMTETAVQQVDQMVSHSLAIKSVMLLEKIRHFAFSYIQTQAKSAHRYENYLGPKILHWIGKELSGLGTDLGVPFQNGRPTAASFSDVLSACPEQAKEERVAAYLSKSNARMILSQMALLSRLRSLFSKNDDATLHEFVRDAVRNSNKLRDVWDKKPIWWSYSGSSDEDRSFALLKALNEHSFSGVLDANIEFKASSENGKADPRSLGLTLPVIQQRANQIVREMHACEETVMTLRKLEERRNRAAAMKKQGYDRALADCHAPDVSSTSKGSIQTGISAFFASSKKAKKPNMHATSVLETTGLPPASADPSPTDSTGKRKGSPSTFDAKPASEKKTKTLAPIFVVAKKNNDDSAPTSCEKAVTTVVNDDGEIEVVSIPKR